MNKYIERLNELQFLQHKANMNSAKLLKIYLGKNPDNLNAKDLEKENEELDKQIQALSLDLGIPYVSIEEV